MASVLIKPAGLRDLAMHREQYDRLESALREAGVDATVERDPWERRNWLEVVQQIAVHVSEDGLALLLVDYLRKYLRGLRRPKSGESRRAVIYGPNGDVLRTVELPDDEPAADQS
ncbi:MAG: hypothetical protein ACLPTJ_15100 [Solirubrobacteraceae bacterium]